MKPEEDKTQSDRRNKFIEDLKTRPSNNDSRFWQTRPLGCSFFTWMVGAVIIGALLLYTGVRLYILNN